MSTASLVQQARLIRFWPALLAAVAFCLIGLGKLVFYTFAVAWLSAAWTFVAVRQGYREAKAAGQGKRAAARQAAESGASPDSGRTPVYVRG